MAILFSTLKANYIPTETPPIQGSLVSIPNQTGANQIGTNNFVKALCDQMDISITPTGGLANNNYSTASINNRVMAPEIDVIRSNEANFIGATFSPTSSILGYTLIKFSKTFLLPNAFYEIQTQAPYWFFVNTNTTPKFEVRLIRATNLGFTDAVFISQNYLDFLKKETGNQGRDKVLIFRDGTVKPAGTYYYAIGMYPQPQFGSVGGTFVADMYSADTILRNETQYNIANTNI